MFVIYCNNAFVSKSRTWNSAIRKIESLVRDIGQFLILAGDHREGYANLDFQQSIDYFYANVNKAVIQSEHGKIFKVIDGKAQYIQGGY